jgi:hypothetical protein
VADGRSTDEVRRDIAVERDELAHAVEHLRTEVGGTFDIPRKIGSHLLIAAPAAFAMAFVMSGGIGATMRYFARRGRER